MNRCCILFRGFLISRPISFSIDFSFLFTFGNFPLKGHPKEPLVLGLLSESTGRGMVEADGGYEAGIFVVACVHCLIFEDVCLLLDCFEVKWFCYVHVLWMVVLLDCCFSVMVGMVEDAVLDD